ncbi:WXG100 family type VII secretion target [Dietzia cinnamea]|uniref:WXG100 family type VII secretion target n=1 Tax=Dietzia cinnamea TaxID=321318 RepID=UPI0028832915|nr:WXG100 family type VII secretion target [Dietzia cinnamea]
MGPFNVDTNELRTGAESVRNAAENARGQLDTTVDSARSAEPGFPGEAAGPFRDALTRFSEFDQRLERTGHSTADRLEDSADRYDRTEDVIEGIFDGLGDAVEGIGRAFGR